MNIRYDLKDVSKSLEDFVDKSSQAVSVMQSWASRKESAAVAAFLISMGDLDMEVAKVEKEYIEQHKAYVRTWKSILEEKKELNAKMAEHAKALTNLQALEKKKDKDPKESKKYEEALQLEQDLSKAVDQLLLVVQKNKHDSLRTGYEFLYKATSDRYEKQTLIQEKIRLTINGFPEVLSRNTDGTFQVGPFSGTQVPGAVWWKGNELSQLLESNERRYTLELKKINDEHSGTMKNLLEEHAAKLAAITTENANRVAKLTSESATKLNKLAENNERNRSELLANHEAKVNSLTASHAEDIARLMHTHAQLEAKNAQQVSALKATNAQQVTALENARLKAIEGADQRYKRTLEELEAREQDIATLQATESRLTDEIANLKTDAATLLARNLREHREKDARFATGIETEKQRSARALRQQEQRNYLMQLEANQSRVAQELRLTTEQILQASLCTSRSCMEVFLDKAALVRSSAESLLPQLVAAADVGIFESKAFEFSSCVSSLLLSAAGAVRSSRAENSFTLLASLEKLGPAAKTLLECKEPPKAREEVVEDDEMTVVGQTVEIKTSGESETDQAKSAANPGPEMVRALYAHAGKVQLGFTLIGFEKGDLMQVVNRRADGWTKVLKDGLEGWAPSSYVEEVPREAPPIVRRSSKPTEINPFAPQNLASKTASTESVAVSRKNSVTVSTDNAAKSAVSSNEAILAIRQILDRCIEVAMSIMRRDKELVGLFNSLARSIDSKVSAAQQSILDALSLCQKLRTESKARDTGRLLEVNEGLLTLTAKIEEGMTELIHASEGMKASLERSRGAESLEEFNAKHMNWFEGIAVAMDTIVEGNPLLTEALRSVVGRKGRHEELQVACRNIAASVAQLAALSRTRLLVRGDEDVSARVERASNKVIEIARDIQAVTRESQDLELASVLMEDLEGLSATQAKRLQMATQVNVLKLEKDLEREREKLGRLRRKTYQDENDNENC